MPDWDRLATFGRKAPVQAELETEGADMVPGDKAPNSVAVLLLAGPRGTMRFSCFEAFLLYDSHGFPLDLTEQMALEAGLSVDVAGVEAELGPASLYCRVLQVSRRHARESHLERPYLRDLGFEHSEISHLTHRSNVSDLLRLRTCHFLLTLEQSPAKQGALHCRSSLNDRA